MNRIAIPADSRRILRAQLTFSNFKSLLFIYVFLTYLLRAHRHLRARGVLPSLFDLQRYLARATTRVFLRLPSVRAKVDAELGKARLDLESKFVPKGADVRRHLALPKEGMSDEWIEKEMEVMDTEMGWPTQSWKQGKLSGAVYHGGEDLERVAVAAFKRYCVANPLHPDVFPAVRKMDAEIVAMCLRMYHNPNGAGTTTAGGTESILLSVKTHRDWARAVKGITEPEIVVGESAHAAFYKAAAYFKIKVHTIPVNASSRQVVLKRVSRAINSNTIMLVGSAVNFPDGCQDDIVGLAALARKHRIGLHVDCCLGSFIMPFLAKAGFPVEPFDFRVEGVTAISCDTHKYGFAPKGTSVIMYRNAELRRHQYYVQPDWMGGVYCSPSIAGSRPGALIAGCWAAMHHMGHSGYLESCRSIVSCAKQIERAITTDFPELYVLGKPPGPLVAFASSDPDVNALEVGDAMASRGWHLNGLSNPPAVHIACTRLTVPVVETFLADLKDSVREAKLKPSGAGQMIAVYGLHNSSPVGPSMVGDLTNVYLDSLYKA